MKAKVFIGSSAESIHVADAIHGNLTRDAECTVWKHAFTPSLPTLAELMRNLRDSDFGIFVLSPDDVSRIKGQESSAARDNVIFELGMFIGRLGPERTFFLLPDFGPQLRLPTDLAGITSLAYEGERRDNNWMAALNPACQQIKYCILKLKSFQDVDVRSGVVTTSTEQSLTAHQSETGVPSGITVEKYNRSYLVKGETKPIKDQLKLFASWNKTLNAWVVPQKKIDRLKAEFPDFEYLG